MTNIVITAAKRTAIGKFLGSLSCFSAPELGKHVINALINETKLDTHFELFYKYDWPGNVRELRNLVERISILSQNENKNNLNQLVLDSLSPKEISKNSNTFDNVFSYPLKEAREKFEKNYLTSQLKKHKGNISKTAEFIGMERSALHRKLKTLGIKVVN